MRAVTGVFSSTERLARATDELHELFGPERVMVFTPETSGTLFERVPVTEDMSPVGAPIAAAITGMICVTLSVGFLASLPSAVVSALLGILIGIAGGTLGWWTGREIERYLYHGVPVDEIFVYQDALQKGRSVVVVLIRRVEDQWRAKHIFEKAGAESVDQARQNLWLGVRDLEAEQYWQGRAAFDRDEPLYREGFEASLMPWLAGRTYRDAIEDLQRRHPRSYSHPAFARGFDRGRQYRIRRHTAPAGHEPVLAPAETAAARETAAR